MITQRIGLTMNDRFFPDPQLQMNPCTLGIASGMISEDCFLYLFHRNARRGAFRNRATDVLRGCMIDSRLRFVARTGHESYFYSIFRDIRTDLHQKYPRNRPINRHDVSKHARRPSRDFSLFRVSTKRRSTVLSIVEKGGQ